MEPAPNTRAEEIVPILRRRAGQETTVTMSDGRVLTVFNIAWGLDEGEDYEHITTNISPTVVGATIDFFSTGDVRSIVAPENGQLVWTQD